MDEEIFNITTYFAKTMKILHVISTLQMGGAERLMVDLLPNLKSLGNDVELLVINGEKTPFYCELEKKGIVINRFQEVGNVYSISHLLRAKKYLNKYDIIHTHTFPCQILMALAKSLFFCKCHFVTTEHSTNNHRRNKIYLKLLDKWMYCQYERIICISDKVRRNLIFYLNSKKNIETINNGIDTQRFFSPINTNLGPIYIITMVASMRDAKDQDTLIKAMHLLGDNYKLQLVGDGQRRKVLEYLSDSLELKSKVIFMGNQTDVARILKKSDIVVMSSHWEGFGLAAVEGMAAGKPIIASDVDGLREVVKNAGLLFPPGDYKTLANEIESLCTNQDKYQMIAQRCQERANVFDIKIMAKKYNSIYKELLDNH